MVTAQEVISSTRELYCHYKTNNGICQCPFDHQAFLCHIAQWVVFQDFEARETFLRLPIQNERYISPIRQHLVRFVRSQCSWDDHTVNETVNDALLANIQPRALLHYFYRNTWIDLMICPTTESLSEELQSLLKERFDGVNHPRIHKICPSGLSPESRFVRFCLHGAKWEILRRRSVCHH